MQNVISIIQTALAVIGLLSILFAMLVCWDERRYKRQQEKENSK